MNDMTIPRLPSLDSYLDGYKDSIHRCPCVICYFKLGVLTIGVEGHHAGDADERDDGAQLSLCPEHHQGRTGIHFLHRRTFHRFWKTNDIQLLGWQQRLLAKYA